MLDHVKHGPAIWADSLARVHVLFVWRGDNDRSPRVQKAAQFPQYHRSLIRLEMLDGFHKEHDVERVIVESGWNGRSGNNSTEPPVTTKLTVHYPHTLG